MIAARPTNNRSANAKRGFTLTEIAIVLGIIGLILGAIWVAAAAVYNNMRISTANRELLQVTQAVRALYATSSTVDPGADMPSGGTPLTYVRAGVFPADALDTAVASTATRTVNPWNGAISIASDTLNSSNDAFAVTFDGLPSQACISLLTASSGQGRDPGMYAAGGGAGAAASGAQGTKNTLGATGLGASTAEGECDNGANANSASFWFALRPTS